MDCNSNSNNEREENFKIIPMTFDKNDVSPTEDKIVKIDNQGNVDFFIKCGGWGFEENENRKYDYYRFSFQVDQSIYNGNYISVNDFVSVIQTKQIKNLTASIIKIDTNLDVLGDYKNFSNIENTNITIQKILEDMKDIGDRGWSTNMVNFLINLQREEEAVDLFEKEFPKILKTIIEVKNKELYEENNRLSKENQGLYKERKQLYDENKRLKNNQVQLENKKKELEENIKKFNEEKKYFKQNLPKEKDRLENKNKQLNVELAKLKNERNDLEKDKVKLQTEKQDLEKDKKQLKNQKDQLEDKKNKLEEYNVQLEDKKNKLKESIKKFNEEKKYFKQNLQNERNDLQKEKKEIYRKVWTSIQTKQKAESLCCGFCSIRDPEDNDLDYLISLENGENKINKI